MNKIFFGTSVHRWNDNRIFNKQAVSLAKKYNVELHAPSNFNKKFIKGVTVIGLPQWSKESDRKEIRKEIWKRLLNSEAGFFHFHDPELIWIGIKAKLILNKRIIYDIHENVSSTILNKNWLNSFQKIFYYLGYHIIEYLIKYIFDHFVLAVKYIKSPCYKKSSVINNYPIIINNNLCEDKNIDLLYLGAVSENRGIFIIIDIVSRLKNKFPQLKVEVVGQIPRFFKERVEKELNSKDIASMVKMRGFIDYNSAQELIDRSKIGLCILLPTHNHINSYPTKLFDYMNHGIPVIGSNFGFLQEIISKSNAGISVDPQNIADQVDSIEYLLNHNDEREKMGRVGKAFIRDNFNWLTEEQKLFNLYSRLGATSV